MFSVLLMHYLLKINSLLFLSHPVWAVKCDRMVDLGWGSRSSPIMVNFGLGLIPQGDNALDSREPGVTNWPVTMLHLVSHCWRITSVLVLTYQLK